MEAPGNGLLVWPLKSNLVIFDNKTIYSVEVYLNSEYPYLFTSEQLVRDLRPKIS